MTDSRNENYHKFTNKMNSASDSFFYNIRPMLDEYFIVYLVECMI